MTQFHQHQTLKHPVINRHHKLTYPWELQIKCYHSNLILLSFCKSARRLQSLGPLQKWGILSTRKISPRKIEECCRKRGKIFPIKGILPIVPTREINLVKKGRKAFANAWHMWECGFSDSEQSDLCITVRASEPKYSYFEPAGDSSPTQGRVKIPTSYV